LVDDVEKFPGHIACDSASRSEIVVPIFAGRAEGAEIDGKEDGAGVGKGRVVAIIDIDCRVESGFDEVDREWLEKLAKSIGEACDWPTVDWSERCRST
jgi:putative methionine-R-sulfoxide reductase with GAF domain